MDPHTGQYASFEDPEAIAEFKAAMRQRGDDPDDMVEIRGSRRAVEQISADVKAERRRKRKAQRDARRANR